MEGPTTVSALIHAATMVKAGVYLVARSFPLMVQTPEMMLIVAVIGGFTALFAATMALEQPQHQARARLLHHQPAGLHVPGLGDAGATSFYHYARRRQRRLHGGMFHLMNHAFFKALLFLSAGAVIHAVHTEDMRLMGGLRKKLKITTW